MNNTDTTYIFFARFCCNISASGHRSNFAYGGVGGLGGCWNALKIYIFLYIYKALKCSFLFVLHHTLSRFLPLLAVGWYCVVRLISCLTLGWDDHLRMIYVYRFPANSDPTRLTQNWLWLLLQDCQGGSCLGTSL